MKKMICFAGMAPIKATKSVLLSITGLCCAMAFIIVFTLPSTVANAQVSTDSLILHMPFDNDALDISGNDNHGILHNVVSDTNRFGDPFSSYMFNGTDSYIEIPASPSMNMIQVADEFSITAWININQWHISGNVFSIFERYNPNTDSGWLLEANWVGGGILFLADETNANNWAGCNFAWNFDQWYHLGFTYSQEQGMAYFYIDGENVCATSYSPPINVADTTASFIIGRSLAGPDEYSDGHIDDYKIYYRILTAEEISDDFTSGKKELALRHAYEVYPNPVKERVTIRLEDQPQATSYTIADLTGRKQLTGRMSRPLTDIDTSELPTGVYILYIEGLPARKIIRS
jgi:hypothetical protein